MVKFIATVRQIETLAPGKAYAVTVILTKEKDGYMLADTQLAGETLPLSIREVDQFVSQRLNVEYDEDPENLDATSKPVNG